MSNTLFESGGVSLVDFNGRTAAQSDTLPVLVLPYDTDKRGLLRSVWVVKERTVLGRDILTSASFGCEADDPDVFTSAVEGMAALGIDVSDPSRWHYLGARSFTPVDATEYPCMAVDVTNVPMPKPREGEPAKGDLVMMGVDDALRQGDGTVCALFVLAFSYVFKREKLPAAPSEDGDDEEVDTDMPRETSKTTAQLAAEKGIDTKKGFLTKDEMDSIKGE